MSLTEDIVDAIILEVGRHQGAINSDRDLVGVRVFVDLESGKRIIQGIKVILESARSLR